MRNADSIFHLNDQSVDVAQGPSNQQMLIKENGNEMIGVQDIANSVNKAHKNEPISEQKLLQMSSQRNLSAQEGGDLDLDAIEKDLGVEIEKSAVDLDLDKIEKELQE